MTNYDKEIDRQFKVMTESMTPDNGGGSVANIFGGGSIKDKSMGTGKHMTELRHQMSGKTGELRHEVPKPQTPKAINRMNTSSSIKARTPSWAKK
jgi:hypothetical protein